MAYAQTTMDAATNRTRRRRIMAASLALAAVAAATVAAAMLWSSDGRSSAAPVPSRTAPPPRAGTTQAVTPAPTVPHDRVTKAGPTRFRVTGPGFTINARVCAMANERPLDPPGEQHHTVCWVRNEFGEAPSTTSATTYVLGHSWAPDPREVLNRLSAPATKQILHAKPVRRDGVPIFPVTVLNGHHITLWTPQGRLDYTIRDAYGVDKMKLGNVRSTMDDTVRNRVVLITCAARKGRDYDYNVVVEAYLTSSQAAA